MKTSRFLFGLRFFAALLLVATTMAVSCPEPDPEPIPEPDPQTKTIERKQFESSAVEGLYVKGNRVLAYDVATFQRAMNPIRRNYRIQSDDQTRYLNVRYAGQIPSHEGDEVECEIHYRLEAGESTTLIVKLVVVHITDEYIWLWNEFQKVGVLARRL